MPVVLASRRRSLIAGRDGRPVHARPTAGPDSEEPESPAAPSAAGIGLDPAAVAVERLMVVPTLIDAARGGVWPAWRSGPPGHPIVGRRVRRAVLHCRDRPRGGEAARRNGRGYRRHRMRRSGAAVGSARVRPVRPVRWGLGSWRPGVRTAVPAVAGGAAGPGSQCRDTDTDDDRGCIGQTFELYGHHFLSPGFRGQ